MTYSLKRIFGALLRRYDRYVRIPMAHRKFAPIRILDSMDSIRYIIDHRCSVSRFGDGEIVMYFGGGGILAIRALTPCWRCDSGRC